MTRSRTEPRRFEARSLLYLVYLGTLAFQPFFSDRPLRDWLWVGALVAVFVPAYFATFCGRGRVRIVGFGVVTVLGVLSLHFGLNSGGGVFFVYAAAAAPFLWRRAVAIRALVALMVLTVALLLVSPFPAPYPLSAFLPALIFIPLIGGLQLLEVERKRADAKLLLAQDEVERLAAIAERERIARDLHDLLGHTLSTITLKSELAARLAESDPARARREIEDVERISRQALGEVRAAVSGYRERGLAAEVDNARLALEASGLVFSFRSDVAALPPRQESALAMVLREAVTNVVRHARASRCEVTLERLTDQVVLRVADNGPSTGSDAGSDNGAASLEGEGNGLRGIRERLGALGGRLELHREGGFVLEARLPVDPHEDRADRAPVGAAVAS